MYFNFDYRNVIFILFSFELTFRHIYSFPIQVFISCEVKLCLKSNYSNSCGSNCSSTLISKQPNESQLETRTYHVTAEPIYVIWEKRKGQYALG